eukprot:Awhi_evm1s7664
MSGSSGVVGYSNPYQKSFIRARRLTYFFLFILVLLFVGTCVSLSSSLLASSSGQKNNGVLSYNTPY